MSVSISFPQLTDENDLWLNRASAQAFFDASFVPSATPSEEGSVKQALLVSYSFDALTNVDKVTINQDEGATIVDVPTLTAYNELRDSYIELATAFNSLLVSLRNAGVLQE